MSFYIRIPPNGFPATMTTTILRDFNRFIRQISSAVTRKVEWTDKPISDPRWMSFRVCRSLTDSFWLYHTIYQGGGKGK